MENYHFIFLQRRQNIINFVIKITQEIWHNRRFFIFAFLNVHVCWDLVNADDIEIHFQRQAVRKKIRISLVFVLLIKIYRKTQKRHIVLINTVLSSINTVLFSSYFITSFHYIWIQSLFCFYERLPLAFYCQSVCHNP